MLGRPLQLDGVAADDDVRQQLRHQRVAPRWDVALEPADRQPHAQAVVSMAP